MNDDYANHVAILFLFLVVMYVAVYSYSFPFAFNDFEKHYTISDVKDMCKQDKDGLESFSGKSVNFLCLKYGKLYYLLNLGLVIDVVLILFLFYYSNYRRDEAEL